MDWANERWVRLYTRDTTTWKMLDWRARTVLMHLMRRVDRAGGLDVGDTGTLGLSAVLELPIEIVEPGIERLLHPRLRVVIETPTAYVIPNFLEAQEAVQTTNHRSAEYRARKRDFALAAAKPAIAEVVRIPAPTRPMPELPPAADETTDPVIVTPRDGAVTFRDASVTPHHGASLLSDPILSEDRIPLPRAIPPSATPVAVPDPLPTGRFPAIGPTIEPADVATVRARGTLAESFWARVSEARLSEAARLGLTGVLPLPTISPAHETTAFRELRQRIREEGANAAAVCEHVLARLVEQARAEQSVEWLSEKTFLAGPWRTARSAIPGSPGQRAGPRSARDPTKARSIHVGRVEPLAPEEYTESGDQQL